MNITEQADDPFSTQNIEVCSFNAQLLLGTGISPMRTMLANQMEQIRMDADPVQAMEGVVIQKARKVKTKQYGVIIDPATELSDEQLKVSYIVKYFSIVDVHEPRPIGVTTARK